MARTICAASAALLLMMGGCVTHTVKDNSVGAQMGGLVNSNSNGGWNVQHGNGFKIHKIGKPAKMKKARPISASSYQDQTNMHGGGAATGGTSWSTWGPPTWPGK